MQKFGTVLQASSKAAEFQVLPIENRLIMFQMLQFKVATGYYNEQGNWVAEPPRPSPVIQTAHLVSVKQKVPVIQDIQDIHPEIDPETSLMQGMTKSQILSTENSKTFNFSRDAVSPHSGSNLQAFSTEKQPIWQKSTNSFSSPVLQVSQRSPRDQDIQNSTNVSVQRLP